MFSVRVSLWLTLSLSFSGQDWSVWSREWQSFVVAFRFS